MNGKGWLALLWLGCGEPGETDGGTAANTETDSDTDSDSDSGSDSDSDSDGGYFLEATGTFDGDPFTMSCGDAEDMAITSAGAPFGEGEFSLTVGCNDDAMEYGVGVGFVGGGPTTATTCGIGASVQVTRIAGGYVNCLLGTTPTFTVDVTELTVDAGGDVVWAGSFEMVSGDGIHEAEVSGSFRALAPVP